MERSERNVKKSDDTGEGLSGGDEGTRGAPESGPLSEETLEGVLGERDALRVQLFQLDHSLAIRLVRGYWGLVNRWLPKGTGRRRVYDRLRGGVWKLGWAMRRWGRQGHIAACPETGEGSREAPSVPRSRDDLSLGVLRRLEQESRSELASIILSGTELREDEGQRPTQIVRELSRRHVPVVFGYWRWETGYWLPQNRLSEGIAQIPLDVMTSHPRVIADAFADCTRIALFTFPHPSFFELQATLNAAGWVTLYDVLDDWEEFHRVGQAVWYDREFEEHLVRSVDAVFVVNECLADRIKSLGASDPMVVANGLRPGIDRIRSPRLLPRGSVTVGYFGYLSPAWFDWDLLRESALARPDWIFYLVGYGVDVDAMGLPENVVFLGKVDQRELAAIAANWDVAIIPFKSDKLAEGADPIKTYEYLAMDLPVVVTGVNAPPGADALVDRATGLEDFLGSLERAHQGRKDFSEQRRSYAAANTWSDRVDQILEVVEEGRQRVREKRFLSGSVG